MIITVIMSNHVINQVQPYLISLDGRHGSGSVRQLHGETIKSHLPLNAATKKNAHTKPTYGSRANFRLRLSVSPFQRISFPSVSYYDTCDGLRT